jgi:hypothetical protein
VEVEVVVVALPECADEREGTLTRTMIVSP